MRVAFARLRARPGRNGLLVLGVAAVAAMLVGVFGGAVISRELLVQKLVRDLPPGEQAFRAELVGIPVLTREHRPDRAAARALGELSTSKPTKYVAFRDFWVDSQFVRLGAIDGPAREVRLLSGRLPERCDATVCEVLQLGRRGRERLDEDEIHLRRVGIGRLEHRELFGSAFTGLRRQRAQASYPTSIVLLGPSAAALDRLRSLELLFRLTGWVVPAGSSSVHDWQIEGLLRRESRAQGVLADSDPAFVLSGPDAALLEAKARRDAYGARMALIGGSVAVGLFGFALVAAAGLRRGIAGERRRLAQRGATRAQQLVAALTEVSVITALGWIVGIVVGAVAIGAVAWRQGLPAGSVVSHALLTWDAAIVFTLGFLAAIVVLVAVVSAEERTEGRGRVRPLDVALAGLLLAVVVGLSRGALDADALEGRDRTFLLLLPALVCIAGGLAAARLLGPLMALAERLARRGSIALRLGLLALARSPARTAATGAFLVVSVALLVFAASYRATLDRGARDEAAFAVPLDVTLTSGASLAEPIDVGALADYERVARGTRAYPVLRATAVARGSGTSFESPTVLGLPHAAFARMAWRSDYSPTSRSQLAGRLRPAGDTALRVTRLPDGADRVRLGATLRGEPVALTLVLRDARGRFDRLPLGEIGPGHSTLGAKVPPGRADLVALEVSLTSHGRAWFFHLAREVRVLKPPSGVLRLGPLTATGGNGAAELVTDWRGWVARGRTATLTEPAGSARVAYHFEEPDSLFLRRAQPTDGLALPVVASRSVADAAGPNGLVTLEFVNVQVRARVVGVARRFPTVGEDEPFVVADATGLETALDADAPGAGTPGELWLAAPRHAAGALARELARPPFAQLARSTQDALYEQAHGDPLARGVSSVLGAAALVALLLAVAGLWLMVLSDLRDERDTFFDLEAQGAGPDTLRMHLRIRALLLLAFGVLGGLLLGFVLSRLVVSLVQVTGAATTPFPPLVLDVGAGSVAAGLAVLVAAGLVAVELTVRRAFRSAAPERASWSFE
jgi:hypothetical protein